MTPALKWGGGGGGGKKEKKKPLYFGFIRISYQPQEQRYPGVLPLCDNDINPFLLLTSGEGLLQSQLRAALPMQRYRPTCSDVHRGILEFTYRNPPWEGGRLCGLGLSV